MPVQTEKIRSWSVPRTWYGQRHFLQVKGQIRRHGASMMSRLKELEDENRRLEFHLFLDRFKEATDLI